MGPPFHPARGFDPDEAQALESRAFSVEEICPDGRSNLIEPAADAPHPDPSPQPGRVYPLLPAPALADHLITIRSAVADWQEEAGLLELARRTRLGEMDRAPMVQVACYAVARVLRGMFE